MQKHTVKNERIKRTYLIFLKEAKRQDDSSIDTVAKSLNRFEEYTHYKDFKSFHFEQAVGFKKHLAKQLNLRTGAPLSKSTINSTLRQLKTFFEWLAMQSGYKSRLNYTDMEYFNLSEHDNRIANTKRKKAPPTLEQIKHTIECMQTNSDIEKRNRALMAFILLTGIRDSAAASLKLKHIDIDHEHVFQDAREVKTKFRKTFDTYFFPVDDYFRQIIMDWIEHLKSNLLFGLDDPLFPKTKLISGETKSFEAKGLTNEHWKTATPIRGIFKEAFGNAGHPYFNPHSFRDTLVALGEKRCQTPEEFKSWSQNLGHEGVLTTLYSYGEVQPHRQAEIFQALKSPQNQPSSNVEEIAMAVARQLRSSNLG